MFDIIVIVLNFVVRVYYFLYAKSLQHSRSCKILKTSLIQALIESTLYFFLYINFCLFIN